MAAQTVRAGKLTRREMTAAILRRLEAYARDAHAQKLRAA